MSGSSSEYDVGDDVLRSLSEITVATQSMQLVKNGVRRHWMAGVRHLAGALGRLVGPAYTMRFLPLREDLSTPESYRGPQSIRAAIEAMPPGRVVVIDASGETGCGTLGDILVARLKARGALGVITDGALRDIAGIREVGLPCHGAGVAAPPSIGGLFFAGWELPVACGGITVTPGDIVAADDDGAVVVPRALAGRIAEEGPRQEHFERFAQLKIAAGSAVEGVYPPSEATLAEYERWCAEGEPPVVG